MQVVASSSNILVHWLLIAVLFFFFPGKLIENLPRELLSNRILKAQSRLNHFHVDSNTSHPGLISIHRVWFRKKLYLRHWKQYVSLMGGSRLCINIYKNKTARMCISNPEQKYREADSRLILYFFHVCGNYLILKDFVSDSI